MEQNRSLESLIDDVLSEMQNRGNAEDTIKRHKRAYSQFCEYALTQGETSYSESLAESFLKEKEKLLPHRSPRFMEPYRIAMNKLADVAQGRDIRLRHLPNGYHLETSCFDWVLPIFEDKLKKRLKNPDDIRLRLRILSVFLSFIESHGIAKLEDISINLIADAFRESPDHPHFHSSICEFLSFAATMGWMPTDLSCFVPKVRKQKIVPTVYSTEDIEKCLSSINRNTQSGKRVYAVLLICARLGLRNTDACELKFSNINWNKKTISIIQMKTGVPLVLPLLPEIEEAITQYLSVRPSSDLPHIFLRHKAPYYPLRNTTLDYELRRLLKQNEINTEGKKRGAHTLRSSLASALLEEGVSYPVIQKTLGHSSPNATKYYTKIDVSRLRDCALAVPPPSGNFARLLGGQSHA